jgi:hypothetical protein
LRLGLLSPTQARHITQFLSRNQSIATHGHAVCHRACSHVA